MNNILVKVKDVIYISAYNFIVKMQKIVKKDRKVVLYGAGLIIVMSIWIAMRAGELSALSLLKLALLIIFSYIAMIIDVRTRQIPNKLVFMMFVVWLLLIMPLTLYGTQVGIRALTDSLLGLITGGGLFLLVYLISRKGLGGGDVKFMATVGLYLGFANTLPAILYGTVLAAIFGLVLLLLKKIRSKDTMPLAPFMFVGIMITIFT